MPRRQEAQDSRSRKLSSHILSTHRREEKEGRETEKRGGRGGKRDKAISPQSQPSSDYFSKAPPPESSTASTNSITNWGPVYLPEPTGTLLPQTSHYTE